MPNRKTPQYSNTVGASSLTALTPRTIFSAASNTKGFRVIAGSAYDYQTAAVNASHFVIATSAPASMTDGVTVSKLAGVTGAGAAIINTHNIVDDLYVPAGYGLYFICGITSTSTFTDVSYTDA